MNYWHMQLHDDDKEGWTRDDILEILKYSLIGCSGKPISLFNQIKSGDIVLIRHGGEVLALTQALENPRNITSDEKNEYIWFDVGLKVRVLEYYTKKSVGGKGWFIPKTLMSIDNDIAYDFVADLYKEFKNKMMVKDLISLLKYKHQVILQGAPGTGKTYTAKNIAYRLIFGNHLSTEKEARKQQTKEFEVSEQYKLIQFHPAYSYEDFVRGIVVESKGSQVEYRTKDKVLAEFAKTALKNYQDHNKTPEIISKEQGIHRLFDSFKDVIQTEIETESKYKINNIAYITAVEDDAFRYQGENWGNSQRMKFEDIQKLLLANVKERKDIKEQVNISGLAKQHATYFLLMLKKFQDFIKDKPVENTVQSIELKNYVLIIDEINRANLPSVLGELIYALEYRGESVESMYDIDSERSLILPPNLYIIGTMNTADRSVGHIDYAIRRRFAFVDIPADESFISLDRAKKLFSDVKTIFKEHLTSDFELNDIELGHSYYLAHDDAELALKLKYEIKPILREYVKDGILLNGAKKEIENLNV
jgi:5-methylcytosine-specific restriction enzyme B